MAINKRLHDIVNAHIQTAIAVWGVPPRCYGIYDELISHPSSSGTGKELISPGVSPETTISIPVRRRTLRDIQLGDSVKSPSHHLSSMKFDEASRTIHACAFLICLRSPLRRTSVLESCQKSLMARTHEIGERALAAFLYKTFMVSQGPELLSWHGNVRSVPNSDYLVSDKFLTALRYMVQMGTRPGDIKWVQATACALFPMSFGTSPRRKDLLLMYIVLSVYERICGESELALLVDYMRSNVYFKGMFPGADQKHISEYYVVFLTAYTMALGHDWWAEQVRHDSVFYNKLKDIL